MQTPQPGDHPENDTRPDPRRGDAATGGDMTDTGLMEGKVAVVTGAGNGIGRAIAVLMAAPGAQAVITDIGVSLTGEGGSAIARPTVGVGKDVCVRLDLGCGTICTNKTSH